jgi:hypothetical protein
MAKNGRNSAFLDCEAHISDRFYIMVLDIIFYRFLKYLNFGSKIKCSLQFYRKTPIYRKKLAKDMYFLAVKPIFQIGYT